MRSDDGRDRHSRKTWTPSRGLKVSGSSDRVATRCRSASAWTLLGAYTTDRLRVPNWVGPAAGMPMLPELHAEAAQDETGDRVAVIKNVPRRRRGSSGHVALDPNTAVLMGGQLAGALGRNRGHGPRLRRRRYPVGAGQPGSCAVPVPCDRRDGRWWRSWPSGVASLLG